MPRTYSEEIKKEAIKLYLEGLSAPSISKKIGANEGTIRGWIKISGNETRIGGTYSKIYDEKIFNQIMELYNNGVYSTEIDKILNLKRGIAAYLLRKNNISLRHRGPKSKIENENYFDTIDTPEKAYYLGWIMADGNISIYNGQYSLKLHVALRDKEIIDNFLKVINSSNKTKVKEDINSSYYVSLTSRHMCDSLIKFGVIPCKSGKEIFPTQIPAGLYHHFIRGFFDGDGITDISRRRSGFVSSKNMIKSILIALNEPQRSIYQNKKNDNIYYFLGGISFSRMLYEYMYNDAGIWLTRKRKRMEMICCVK